MALRSEAPGLWQYIKPKGYFFIDKSMFCSENSIANLSLTVFLLNSRMTLTNMPFYYGDDRSCMCKMELVPAILGLTTHADMMSEASMDEQTNICFFLFPLLQT